MTDTAPLQGKQRQEHPEAFGSQLRRRTLRWLNAAARHPGSHFALYYFLAILAFAVVDARIARTGDTYYAPYAHLDPAGSREEIRVATILSNAIKAELSKNISPTDEYIIIRDSIRVYDLRYQDGRLSFTVSCNMQGKNGFIEDRLVRIYSNYYLGEFKYIYLNMNYSEDSLILRGKEYEGYDRAFDRMFENKSGDMGKYIEIKSSDHEEIADFENELTGKILGFYKNFPRMLYFSAITITTVGYGDIVPLSSKAKLSAALEATSGIVLAGLFLNAITVRAARRQARAQH